MDEIKVTVVDYGRKNLMLRYVDPMTGRRIHKSAGTNNRKEAQKAAGKWESDLREGRYQPPSKTTWAGFRERYEDEVLSSLAPKTDAKVSAVFNVLEQILSPGKLADLTAGRLSFYQAKLREMGRSETTIKGNLAHIKAALSWAVRMGILAKMPAIEVPRRAKGQKSFMKGRPIVGEEFDRLLAALPGVVAAEPKLPEGHKRRELTPAEQAARDASRAAIVASWEHYLRGLWLSGLRLTESLELWWDRDDRLQVDLSDEHPMLKIPAALEKGHRDRLLPMAPDFAEWLLQTPREKRTGPVFNPLPRRPQEGRLLAHRVGELIVAAGEKAGIKVNTSPSGKVKYASAHDLRRSFGQRWAERIMPQQLMELMRHESIETTLKYYVGRNAQSTAAALWKAYANSGNTSGNTATNSATNTQSAESGEGVNSQ